MPLPFATTTPAGFAPIARPTMGVQRAARIAPSSRHLRSGNASCLGSRGASIPTRRLPGTKYRRSGRAGFRRRERARRRSGWLLTRPDARNQGFETWIAVQRAVPRIHPDAVDVRGAVAIPLLELRHRIALVAERGVGRSNVSA